MRKLYMSRTLGIDWGTKNIGLAISDETHLVASPLITLHSERNRTVAEIVAKFIKTNASDISQLIIGNPLGLDGKPTQKSKEVRQFAEELKQITGLPYTLWNETGTSILAESSNGDIHNQAARLILQEFLDFKRSGV
jgi:putative Holliday junction resolvase